VKALFAASKARESYGFNLTVPIHLAKHLSRICARKKDETIIVIPPYEKRY
jgi:hypothetical protein